MAGENRALSEGQMKGQMKALFPSLMTIRKIQWTSLVVTFINK